MLTARFLADQTSVAISGDRGYEVGDTDTEEIGSDTEGLPGIYCTDTLDDDLDMWDCTLSGAG